MTQNLLSVVARHEDAQAAHCQLQQLGSQALTASPHLQHSPLAQAACSRASERSADGCSSRCQEPLPSCHLWQLEKCDGKSLHFPSMYTVCPFSAAALVLTHLTGKVSKLLETRGQV